MDVCLTGNLLEHCEISPFDQAMDEQTFMSCTWQRVYQYLEQYDRQVEQFQVKPDKRQGTMQHCLQMLLK